MTRLRGGLVLVVIVLATFSFAPLSTAQQPARILPLDPTAFVVVSPGAASTRPAAPTPGAPIADFPDPRVTVTPRSTTPAPAARVVRKTAPAPRVTQRVSTASVGGGHRVRGTATWYCRTGVSVCTSGYPGGLYAAAGAEIRIGNWRGRHVRVCGGGNCVVVKLIDWCACGGARIIDLYSDAFRRLAPLSKGGLTVTVSW